MPDFHIDNRWILAQRGPKNEVDPTKPYASNIEKERSADGTIEDVITIFLTNKECPFRCLMCDLWKNTLDHSVPFGSIPAQIEYALERLPSAKTIKLYNSGNFFDRKAIPFQDHRAITDILKGFETVIIENHPAFINQQIVEFRDKLNTGLQVAIGLETVQTDVLKQLNKQMTLDDFSNSVQFLISNDIPSRAFILLKPPFMDEKEGVFWAKKSLDFAFDSGVECCAVIPTRAGNGALDELGGQGYFQIPKINSLEEVLDYGINLGKGRVFADLWDLKYFSDCESCLQKRKDRMHRINLNQQGEPMVQCNCS